MGDYMEKNNLPELVTMAKAGDTHAFAKLYEGIYKDLYRFAWCMLKDTQRAEDAVSDAVLSAFENLHKLKKDSSFQHWMFQIVANECRRQFRFQSKIIPVEDIMTFQSASTNMPMEDCLSLKEAFITLSEQERLIVGLSIFGGYRTREIARFLHKKDGTIRSIKSRALNKMKHFLGKDDEV